jgi:alpha-L-rhamnosidase
MKFKFTIFFSLFAFTVFAQDFFKNQKAGWLKIAKETEPILTQTIRKPIGVVSVFEDDLAYQGWNVKSKNPMDSLYQGSFKKKSGIIIDFGEHLTGYFTFKIEDLGRVADAALRLKFTFAEVPSETALPFDPYTGGLSRAWLQDEIVTISEVPNSITIPRRVSFRYVKIEVLGSSKYSDFKISNVELKASTSVRTSPTLLASSTDPLIAKIDNVGLKTLKECMQTVYEDGPKRDRRLWIGDLYLESLANTYSFKNHNLTKHCLYLLAGLAYDDGVVPATVFERPQPHHQVNRLFDYALIYNVTLKEYLDATGDKKTALDLWQVAKKQIEIPKKYMGEDGMLDYEKANKEWWLFFDWRDGLNKQAALQGVVIWAYKNTYELAKKLGKENEVAELPALIKKMTKATQANLYDAEKGLYVSGVDKQISYCSQAWMILSGVATKEHGAKALKALPNTENVVYPGAPYLYHYVIEAMIQVGMEQEAKQLLTTYWGDMIRKGADTFWEVYDPKNDFLSPYNFFLVNSYCHAWSCTPVYFIRKYPQIFQK